MSVLTAETQQTIDELQSWAEPVPFEKLGDVDNDVPEALIAVWRAVNREALKGIQIQVKSPVEEPSLERAPGFTTYSSPPTVVLSSELDTATDWFEKRPGLRRVVGEKVGVPNPSREVMARFVVGHELGHALHHNQHPDVEVLKAVRRHEMASLPYGGISPGRLQLEVEAGDVDLQQLWVEHEEYFRRRGINSPDQILPAQEEAYRNLPGESYADDVGGHVLNKYWEQLGLPPREQPETHDL